jgi:hypothetical protein
LPVVVYLAPALLLLLVVVVYLTEDLGNLPALVFLLLLDLVLVLV